jgi:hypothetical protein
MQIAECGTESASRRDPLAPYTVYEQAMFSRSAAEAADAHMIVKLCLGDRAPFSLIEFLTSAPGR